MEFFFYPVPWQADYVTHLQKPSAVDAETKETENLVKVSLQI